MRHLPNFLHGLYTPSIRASRLTQGKGIWIHTDWGDKHYDPYLIYKTILYFDASALFSDCNSYKISFLYIRY